MKKSDGTSKQGWIWYTGLKIQVRYAPDDQVGKHMYDLKLSDGDYNHVITITVYIVDAFEPPSFASSYASQTVYTDVDMVIVIDK